VKVADLQKSKARSGVRFDTAVQIRELLDARQTQFARLLDATIEDKWYAYDLVADDAKTLSRKRAQSAVKHDLAAQISKQFDDGDQDEISESDEGKRLLAAAAKKYGSEWGEDVENEVWELTPMDVKEILNRKAADEILYDTAIQIRQILDAARKSYGASEWDGDDVESQVMELVTEE